MRIPAQGWEVAAGARGVEGHAAAATPGTALPAAAAIIRHLRRARMTGDTRPVVPHRSRAMPIRKPSPQRAPSKRTQPRKRKTASSTRKHEVKANLANFELAKARSALTLEIYANREKIGELQVGRGSLYWQGGKKQRSKRLDWTAFADKMNELAYGTR
jgi:hypothetical protein